jgi:hypothetical protein
MAKLYNLARMSTATTGTGTITLGSAISGYLTFALAGVANGETVSYGIKDGSNSEVGTGVYTSSGTTLTRSVTKSTNSDTAISLSGSAEVFITARAEDIVTPVASQAQAEAATDNTTAMTPLRSAQEYVANVLSFKNIVGRNGGCEVWQRGTSIAVAASSAAYTLDGWYLNTSANQAHTVSRQAGLNSNSRYSARVQRNNSQTGTGTVAFGFPLDVDELNKLQGKAVAVSYTVSTGANWSPSGGTLTSVLYTGTGAPTKRGLGGAYTGEVAQLTTSTNLAQGASATRVISAISSALPSNIGQAELQFQWTPSGTAGANDWFQIDDVQVEVVPTGISAVTPTFERTDYVFDLMRCYRFCYQPTGSILPAGNLFASIGGNNVYSLWLANPVPMRAAPSYATVSGFSTASDVGGESLYTNATADGLQVGVNSPVSGNAHPYVILNGGIYRLSADI